MEVGESLEETALRELFEETGLTVDTLALLGVASGQGVFHKGRNACYVTALYRAITFNSSIRLSQEHLDGKFFALGALPAALSVSVRWVAARIPISAPER